MGVIKRLLFRDNPLNKVRHKYFFLDMEENIHIHYRDLRIELSRGEFEDIARAFRTQSEELLGIIKDRDYQDGKLPNANAEDVRIWTEAKLDSGVKYHPTRVSLEECEDGYHLHYRNYKLLLDKDEFRLLTEAFRQIDLNQRYARTYNEVKELLEANEVDFACIEDKQREDRLEIMVENHHLPKIEAIFKYIGFYRKEQKNLIIYAGDKLNVYVKAGELGKIKEISEPKVGMTPGYLADYLKENRESIDKDQLNTIKCQVLDTFGCVQNRGEQGHVNLDYRQWFYDESSGRVIFPYVGQNGEEAIDLKKLYKLWSSYLTKNDLHFIKPKKICFTQEQQEELYSRVMESLNREAEACDSISKIYMMGSAARKDMGVYKVPFVHSSWAKLGSDIDILIEIDSTKESDLPESWHYINQSKSNHCYIYHLSQLQSEGTKELATKYQNIDFFHHLIDAYVYFPSKGNKKSKDEFLAKYKAKLIYEKKKRGGHKADYTAIQMVIDRSYGFIPDEITKLEEPTENALYKLVTGKRNYVLKVYKVAGNYSKKRLAQHTEYEALLVDEMHQRQIDVVGLTRKVDGDLVTTLEGASAILFDFIEGNKPAKPEYPLQKIAKVLAEFHEAQIEHPLSITTAFTFEDILDIWLPYFRRCATNKTSDKEVNLSFEQLEPILIKAKADFEQSIKSTKIPLVHNHGDMTPSNVILDAQGTCFLFDFQNAFYGSRLLDIVDGAYEFSLAGKYIDQCDFNRFHTFIDEYKCSSPFTQDEENVLESVVSLLGVIKFAKEVRMMDDKSQNNLRRRRALAIAQFVVGN